MSTITTICPTGPNELDIQGCGMLITEVPDPEDGWIDCPYCGLMFDPEHPENVAAVTA